MDSDQAFNNDTQQNIADWLNGDYDEASKNEIRRLQREDPEELADAFYKKMSFGTGGLRGIMGVGTNRLNFYTIRAATQGLANYLNNQSGKELKRVLIGYDCRNYSKEFAEESAKVLAANGIEVLLFKELRPVALVSFGVRYKRCSAGILITASHNPAKYNGYKVYWNDGGQVLPPHDKGIIEEVNKVSFPTKVPLSDLSDPLIQKINGQIDQAYLAQLHVLQLHPGNNSKKGSELKVVYTSLHGAGITTVPPALRDWGFTNLQLVEEQSVPDGNFPTVKSPNPEDSEALSLGVEKLVKTDSDILIATDPDTDRLGVVVMHENKPFFFNGNEMACILLEHICSSLRSAKQMPAKAMFVKTIVTTELFKKIAERYGGTCLDVLTGFKYIGQKMSDWDGEQKVPNTMHHYIFGAEESYGYLYGTHVRDKDAIISCCLVCEAALEWKLAGKTLVDFLYEIYQKYGVFREKLFSLTFEGKKGAEKMKAITDKLRKHPLDQVAGKEVETMEDYLSRKSLSLRSGKTTPILLPKSDVLRFWLEDGTKIVIRPSGTEPKIKIYCGLFEKHPVKDRKSIESAISACDARLNEILEYLKKSLH